MHVPERIFGTTEAAGTAQEEKEEGDEVNQRERYGTH